ncbi:rod shape-determining protein MreC [Alginatibacterium sediminis]|uniref:Cell shape-determining protein MreC n=1 Tax=Alginatibacterium sediminis TaxID=2164068 RepID=A0A420EL87_9ALTE|nr:rod shape-determining protein MreC [Alginatibacterium sediminis]RKF21364.1 rod shape-determining protein MreC [Alginatibacterium sediminis]
MKPIFGQGPSLELRLLVAVILSFVLVVVDSSFSSFNQWRMYLQAAVSPLQYIANAPNQAFDEMSTNLKSRSALLQENQNLSQQIMQLKTDQLLLENLGRENDRLRALLGSPLRNDSRKVVAEVMAVDSEPFSFQVVIDKGSADGVYEGQSVIDENGVVGQVYRVGATNSNVLLINDTSHGIPVRVARNDIRAIAVGSGDLDRLVLPNLPRSTDIQVGDVLVTSGLGGRFPEGYPVAEVSRFDYLEGRPYAEIEAKPYVKLDRLRYLLLLWPESQSRK